MSKRLFLRHAPSKITEKPLDSSNFSSTKAWTHYRRTIWSSYLFFTQFERVTMISSTYWYSAAQTLITSTFMGRLQSFIVYVKAIIRLSRSWFPTEQISTSLIKTDRHLCSTQSRIIGTILLSTWFNKGSTFPIKIKNRCLRFSLQRKTTSNKLSSFWSKTALLHQWTLKRRHFSQ
jgi:hypothetical protein